MVDSVYLKFEVPVICNRHLNEISSMKIPESSKFTDTQETEQEEN